MQHKEQHPYKTWIDLAAARLGAQALECSEERQCIYPHGLSSKYRFAHIRRAIFLRQNPTNPVPMKTLNLALHTQLLRAVFTI